jgi:hypothetical protein
MLTEKGFYTMRFPMPSPAGTNHERLFLPADFGRRSAGAYDEYKPLPHITGDGDLFEEFRAWLSAKLNAEDARKLDEYLSRLEEEGLLGKRMEASGETYDSRRRRPAMDARRFGTSSAAEADFFRMFPDAKRIGCSPIEPCRH